MGFLTDVQLGASPTQVEAGLARDASALLKGMVDKRLGVQLRFEPADGVSDAETVALPDVVARMLLHILDEMAHGNAVALVPLHAELTTQQAADMLNVSRPFVVRLIEGGRLPHRMVGTHRRVRVDDLMVYKQSADRDRDVALLELAEETRRLGLDH